MSAISRTLWLLFTLFVLYAGTIPFHFSANHESVRARVHALPLNPLIAPDTGHRLSIPDVVQNVLLFLPFGALGVLAANDRRRVITRIAVVTALGFALSFLVESLQLFTSDRVASVSDVLFNTAGALAGAVAAWQFRNVFAAGLRRLQAEGLADVEELRPFAIALGVIAVAFWQPFDVTIEIGNVAGKIHMLRADVWQFSGLRDEGTSVMLATFLAATFASYLSALGETHAGRKAAAIGIPLVCLLEASQILIGSRMPGLWDAAVASTGVGIGAALWTVSSTIIWPRLWTGVFIAMTIAGAALQMLSPFEIAGSYHMVGWFPFLGYYRHTTFETLSHVVELMLLYFPLGFWMARRPRGLFQALFITFLVAAPIEYAQGWVIGRYPDITDVALSLAGAWLGVRAGLSKSRHSGGQ